ncbi:hypothetical protein WJX72_003252 [[Myrmecia] bisecta]|uniref:Chlorophyll a-b binding protein, chloroplastic n=1 Tax=[Myrmecia] bisecta TaxID=41462 RepID=A0AAW1Q3J6_9CHLO
MQTDIGHVSDAHPEAAPLKTRSMRSKVPEDTSKRRTARWFPFWRTKAPKHLDGSYPGDAGFDPAGFAEDPERLQLLRESEVLSSRWAMLGVLGLLATDLLGGPVYLLPELTTQQLLPYSLAALLAVGAFETVRGAKRASQPDVNSRIYPGKSFDPLGLAKPRRQGKEAAPGLGVWSAWLGGLPGWLSGGWWLEQQDRTVKEVEELKTKELKNGRLAMLSFAGVYLAASLTGKGPVTLLVEHLSDPVHHTVVQTLQQ